MCSKRIKKLLLITLFVGVLTLNGCTPKPLAVGDSGSIVVVADDIDRPLVQNSLEQKFGKKIATPQQEPLFTLFWEDGKTLAEYTSTPIIILTASINGYGPTARLLNEMLTPTVKEGVISGEYSVFKRNDPWARHQLLLIITGKTQSDIGQNVDLWVDSLFQWAVDFERNRLSTQLFRRGEQTKLEEELTDKHGFNIRIQHDYFLSQDNDSLSFSRLIRHHPDRWVTIAWGPMSEEKLLTPDFIYERRKLIGSGFLDPVIHYDDFFKSETSTLNGQKAVLVRGLWATGEPIGGGPFFTYGIWDSALKRYYIIDGAVFSPGETKMKYLWQLETICQSFSSPSTRSIN